MNNPTTEIAQVIIYGHGQSPGSSPGKGKQILIKTTDCRDIMDLYIKLLFRHYVYRNQIYLEILELQQAVLMARGKQGYTHGDGIVATLKPKYQND